MAETTDYRLLLDVAEAAAKFEYLQEHWWSDDHLQELWWSDNHPDATTEEPDFEQWCDDCGAVVEEADEEMAEALDECREAGLLGGKDDG